MKLHSGKKPKHVIMSRIIRSQIKYLPGWLEENDAMSRNLISSPIFIWPVSLWRIIGMFWINMIQENPLKRLLEWKTWADGHTYLYRSNVPNTGLWGITVIKCYTYRKPSKLWCSLRLMAFTNKVGFCSTLCEIHIFGLWVKVITKYTYNLNYI